MNEQRNEALADRCHGRAEANETSLGWIPGSNSFDLEGMDGFDAERLEEAQSINVEDWRREIAMQDELFFKLRSHLPKELVNQRELLISRL